MFCTGKQSCSLFLRRFNTLKSSVPHASGLNLPKNSGAFFPECRSYSYSFNKFPLYNNIIRPQSQSHKLFFQNFRRGFCNKPKLSKDEFFRKIAGELQTKNSGGATHISRHAGDGVAFVDRVMRAQNKEDLTLYAISLWIFMIALAYASVPLYRLACQNFGWNGEINRNVNKKLRELATFREKNESRVGINRKFLIRFDARTGGALDWDFEPVQNYVVTRAGESTLAFFTAKNNETHPITGVSFYTVLPYDAARYFIKIQCFCFEEQRLRGDEIVDMPVLFFIDPNILEDPKMSKQPEITLSYIFYEAQHTDLTDLEEDDYSDSFWEENEKRLGINRDEEVGRQMKEIIDSGRAKAGKLPKPDYSGGHHHIPVETIYSENDIDKLDVDDETKFRLYKARREAILADKTYGAIPGASRGDMRYYKQDYEKTIFQNQNPLHTVVPQMKDKYKPIQEKKLQQTIND